jgi:hypothetical protein
MGDLDGVDVRGAVELHAEQRCLPNRMPVQQHQHLHRLPQLDRLVAELLHNERHELVSTGDAKRPLVILCDNELEQREQRLDDLRPR